jgi:hypothetical protein
MALKTRIDVFTRETVFRPGFGLSPKEISAQFAALASQDIAEIDADNAKTAGRELPHRTFVDGRETTDLASVRPDGVIVAEWTLTTEVVQFVWDRIQKSAPQRTGRFKASQRIYADGVEVDNPQDTIGASEVIIAPTVPYARKIEGGFSKQGGAWATNPNGLYHAVATLAASRFGNIAKIKFGTREVLGGATDLSAWASDHTANIAHEGKRRKAHARDSRQPSVVITFR